MHLKKIALIVEYEGSAYHGFQLQPQSPTVQEVLEAAVLRLTGERRRILCASRTDASVHALAQVASFLTAASHSMETFVKGLNAHLPKDVRVQRACELPRDYDIRKRAEGRWYRYVILNRPVESPLLRSRALWVSRPLDVATMNRAASHLVGRRDFAPFAGALDPARPGTVRVLTRAEFRRKGGLLLFEVEGNSFLPQQVRRMAGALLEVGLGKLEVGAFQKLADSGRRGVAGPTLPPHGLYLMEVRYPDFPPSALAASFRHSERSEESSPTTRVGPHEHSNQNTHTQRRRHQTRLARH